MERLVPIYQGKQCHTPEDHKIQFHVGLNDCIITFSHLNNTPAKTDTQNFHISFSLTTATNAQLDMEIGNSVQIVINSLRNNVWNTIYKYTIISVVAVCNLEVRSDEQKHTICKILCFVDRVSLYNLVNKANLVHNFAMPNKQNKSINIRTIQSGNA